jgi:hypothetical protein
MKEVLWFIVICWVTAGGLFWLALPILWTGLRKGRLVARGRIYDRDSNPGMYWGGVAFWIASLAFALWLSLFLVWGLTAAHNAR